VRFPGAPKFLASGIAVVVQIQLLTGGRLEPKNALAWYTVVTFADVFDRVRAEAEADN
jgi:hypothetical protein